MSSVGGSIGTSSTPRRPCSGSNGVVKGSTMVPCLAGILGASADWTQSANAVRLNFRQFCVPSEPVWTSRSYSTTDILNSYSTRNAPEIGTPGRYASTYELTRFMQKILKVTMSRRRGSLCTGKSLVGRIWSGLHRYVVLLFRDNICTNAMDMIRL